MLRSAPLAALVCVSTALTATAARAEDDLLDSIYTESGYELRQDARLFTLFLAMNATGYGDAETTRERPFPKRVFHPIRELLRTAMVGNGDVEKVKKTFDAYLDAHPLAMEAYVQAALALGDLPDFKAGEGAAKELAGLDGQLAAFASAVKVDKVLRNAKVAPQLRDDLKRLRDAADQPFAKLRAAYRLNEEDAPALALIPNLLDAPDRTYAFLGADGGHVVVLGMPAPGRPIDLAPALRAYSQLLAAEAGKAVTVPQALTDALELLKTANLTPAADAKALIVESFRRAVEAKALGGGDVDQAFKGGFLLVREFAKALEEGKDAFPADKGTFAQQVVARFDPKKAAAELGVKPPKK